MHPSEEMMALIKVKMENQSFMISSLTSIVIFEDFQFLLESLLKSYYRSNT
jgi:hypothetical protein